jgi:nucleotide-binding universal stress UspA family protein
MRNILLFAHDDAGQEARINVALDLRRALGGHLLCVDVTIIPEEVTDYAGMGGSALLLADEELNETRNAARLRLRLTRENVPFDWVDATGDLATCIRDASGLADLVVANRQLDHSGFPHMMELVGKLVVEAQLPVLAVPETATGFAANGQAVVAWDGSASAQAALRAAVPLLKRAGGVTLLYIDDGSIKQPLGEAVQYLARHGIAADVRREQKLAKPAEILLEAAQAGEADYIVMGAYGHARMLEELFGGTTARLLTESPVPLFLVHRRGR